MYKLGLLGSARSRASLVLPPPRAEYLVRAQAVHRCRGLPCGAGEEIVWRSRGVAYSVVLVEIWYILVECSTRTISTYTAPACMHSLDRNSRVRTEISLVRIHTSLPYYNLGVTRESPN